MMLDGKVAVVSGIAPGMGRDISLALAREGADIVLGGRTREKLDAVAAEVEAAEQRGITFQEVYDEVAAERCLGYLPTSEEIAGTVVFFASPLARAVTGQSLGVNAGHWFH